MVDNPGYISLVLSVFVALPAWYWLRQRPKNALPYPPGPKAYPVIGNFSPFPAGIPLWEGLASVAKQYDTDVLYLKLFGTEMVVLSSSEAVSGLLDQRSAIYSDKPRTPMLELTGAPEWSMAFMPYGPRWRAHRKLFHEFIDASTVKNYDVNQVKAVSNFLINLYQTPGAFREHINLFTGSLALSIGYGIKADTPDNEFFHMYQEAMEAMTESSVPGAFLVDVIPPLRYLPSWFPGIRFHACAKRVKESMYNAMTHPVEHVAERLESGVEIDTSMVSTCLENLEDMSKKGVSREVICRTAGNMLLGMSETTNSTLSSFFLAMARNTDVMRTAQRQLDSVLGGERLPDHSDIDDLPYIMAIVKETFRWAPPPPLGATHRLMEDDVYHGMLIPGGVMMLENIWAICYNEVVYPDPHTYDPTRFLDKDGKIDPSVKAPETRIFGSGRRMCPGRHFAIRMLCFTIASILATFDILPPINDNGCPKIPEPKYHNTFIRHAMPFECVVKPRSEKATKLIHNAVLVH